MWRTLQWIKLVGLKQDTVYVSLKVQKTLKNGLLVLKLILSAIVTPTYKLAKVLVPILPDIIQNDITVQDSFTFADEIWTQNSDLNVAGLDIDPLFANIPSDKTIVICVRNFFIILKIWFKK